MPRAVEINIILLLTLAVHLLGLVNGHFVNKLVENLRCKFADVRVFPHERDKPRYIGLPAVYRHYPPAVDNAVNSKMCPPRITLYKVPPAADFLDCMQE